MGRIFLFGSAIVALLLLTLIYAIVSGHYLANTPTPSPSASASASPSAAASASAVASASATATPTATATAAASGAAATVMITNFSFGSDLTIAAGTTVTFTNMDTVKHTATQGENGVRATDFLFDLQLEPGASDSYTFAAPGVYKVTCTVHSTMNMTITVQ
jgi:plastocyanin